jgi:hypothetical protein
MFARTSPVFTKASSRRPRPTAERAARSPEHGAWALSLAAAAGGLVAGGGAIRAAPLFALATIVFALFARRDLLASIAGRQAPARGAAGAACAGAAAASFALVDPGGRATLFAVFFAALVLAAFHALATLWRGPRDFAIEASGAALATLAGPFVLAAARPTPLAVVAAFAALLGMHAVLRVGLARKALAARRALVHEGGDRGFARDLSEPLGALAFAAAASAGAALGAFSPAAPRLPLAGPLVTLAAPAARDARAIGFRETAIAALASVVAGLAVR